MKYEVFDVEVTYPESKTRYVTVSDGDAAKTFPADKSNADYVQFLVDAQLTDKQVAALETDTWFDFPA